MALATVALAWPTSVPVAAAQSLWSVRAGSLVTDLRATRAGDIITILVDEQSSAEKRAETKFGRDADYAASLSVPKLHPRDLRQWLEQFQTTAKANSDYEGTGSTTRTDRAAATLSARVMRVLDNGTLLIEGRRLVVLQNETQTLVVSGLVRAVDVMPDNTVRSSLIADAEVRIEGQGAISLRQRPGLFQRVFDWLGLF